MYLYGYQPPQYPAGPYYDPYNQLKQASIKIILLIWLGAAAIAIVGGILLSTAVRAVPYYPFEQRNDAQIAFGWILIAISVINGIGGLLWLILVHLKLNPQNIWYISQNLNWIRYVTFVAFPLITKFEQQLNYQIYGTQQPYSAQQPGYQPVSTPPQQPTAPMAGVYTCPNCGAQVAPGMPACSNCGFRFQ